MLQTVRDSPRVVRILLAIITLPFLLWGVDSYFHNYDGGSEVAAIGTVKISRQDFQQAVSQQKDRLRQMFGAQFNPSILDSPEARQRILDSMIDQRLLALETAKLHLTASDNQLREVISAIPALQENGVFSRTRYETALQAQGLNQVKFEENLRQDLAQQQLVSALTGSAFVTPSMIQRGLGVQLEKRKVSEFAIKPEVFLAQINIAPEAIKAFYEKNRKQFETPEQIRAEYIVLSQAELAEHAKVTENEIEAWYKSHIDQYKQPEMRRASHLLLSVAKDATAAEVKAVQNKAELLFKEISLHPNEFARLAKTHSQDPVSAAQGGDLGLFGRGAMVKPFEDAVFSLPLNQVGHPVRSDFGFHIIKVTQIHSEKTKNLDSVRKEIESALKTQLAAKKYTETAEAFSNSVYEQATSLKPAAEKFNLLIQQTGFFNKTAPTVALLAHDKLISALFSEDVIKNKHNTEAVEVAPHTLVAARVLEHKPATIQPLEVVYSAIEANLKHEEAIKRATKEGEKTLALLKAGKIPTLSWSTEYTAIRQGHLPRETSIAIFGAPMAQLPAYVGVPLNAGYTLYKITQVIKPDAVEIQAQSQAQGAQLTQQLGEEEFNAYLAGLRKHYKVSINKSMTH